MRLGLIYKLTIIGTNYYLFGSTIKKLDKRKSQYLSKLKYNKYQNPFLQNLYNKYGEESLVWEEMQSNIPENILEHVEDIWIGANCARIEDKKGGLNVRDAFRPRHSKETREKISLGNIGKKQTQEAKDKISKAHKGKKKPEGFGKGKKLYQHQIDAIVKRFSKPVYQYTVEGIFIREWKSATEAAKFYKTNQGRISTCCRKETNTCKGFIWRYEKEDIPSFIRPTIGKANSKKVNQYSLDGTFLKEWSSTAEVSRVLNVNQPNISSAAIGKQKTAYGFKWGYGSI